MTPSFSKQLRNPCSPRWMVPVSAILLAALATGCHSLRVGHVTVGRSYQPENIFLSAPVLPAELKRVAVLAVTTDPRFPVLDDGRATLEPVLISELLKTRKFEVVQISPEASRGRNGQVGWTAEEVLPDDFFPALQASSGCDAVLFCQLTTFRAYSPIAVGWRMKLVDIRSRQILWAGDEVFDAGQSAVLNGARQLCIGGVRRDLSFEIV